MGKEITTFEQAIDTVLYEMRETLVSKQKDYGPGNIGDTGEVGLVVRVNDKVARLKNLVLAQEQKNLDTIKRLIEEHNPDHHDPYALLARIMGVAESSTQPKHESIDDTWIDIANYGIIAQMFRQGLWGLPTEDK